MAWVVVEGKIAMAGLAYELNWIVVVVVVGGGAERASEREGEGEEQDSTRGCRMTN